MNNRMEKVVSVKNSFSFFRNYECENFPCHKTENDEKFNCLFCFCPLYHLKDCGGNYSFVGEGIKDCSGCMLPHDAKNYDYVINKLRKPYKGSDER